ncbi:MAG: endonuclease/exonuclease/phosphatase family protein [Planctomycetota bacterium]
MDRRCLILTFALGMALPVARAGERPKLRVLTYNIHHGEGSDERLDLARIARIIRHAEPHLVALQEIDNKTRRTNHVDQAAELARLTDLRAAFGKAIDYQGGQYGNAILSRWELRDVKTHALPHVPKREARCALAATVTPGGGLPNLLFVSTHLQNGPKAIKDRIRQAKRLNQLLVNDDDIPTIVAGDLNAVPFDPSFRLLASHWLNASGVNPPATCPADQPRWPIDHVLLRPATRWRIAGVTVLEEPVASDHRPLLVVLEWLGEP